MVENNSRTSVGDYVTLVRGTTYKGALVGQPGPALLGLGSIEPGGGFRIGQYKTYGGDCPAELMLFPGDTYASLKGATKDGKMIGSVARVPPSVPIGRLTQDTVKLVFRDPNREDASYLHWILRTPQYREYCAGHAMGSAVVALSRRDFLTYPVPPPTVQRRVAIVLLDAIEERIELNRRMNETLEDIERAIFVARAREEDWIERSLEDICIIYDGPHATPKLVDTGSIFLGISNLANGTLNLSDVAHVTDEDFARWTRRVTPRAGDVVFSYETRLGQAALIPQGLKCCLGRRMGLLRAKSGAVFGVALLHAYLSAEFQEVIRQRTIHGSTVDRIPLVEMGRFSIRLPDSEGIKQLVGQLLPFRNRIEENQRMNNTLTALRNTLLPKLISGELRVKAAEKIVEAVA